MHSTRIGHPAKAAGTAGAKVLLIEQTAAWGGRAVVDGPPHGLWVGVGRDHHNGNLGVMAQEPRQGGEAQCARHVQVEQQEIERLDGFRLLLQVGHVGGGV